MLSNLGLAVPYLGSSFFLFIFFIPSYLGFFFLFWCSFNFWALDSGPGGTGLGPGLILGILQLCLLIVYSAIRNYFI